MAIKNSYFTKFDGNTNTELDFMQTCTKANIRDIVNQVVHIDHYGIVNGRRGDYTILHVREYPQFFYFGGEIITNVLKEVDKDGMHEALKQEDIIFTVKQSSNGNDYIAIQFGEA